jgi:hypothetical protein
MQTNELIAHLGPQIPPTAVRDYAKSRGWESGKSSRMRRWILTHSDSSLRQLIIPIDQDSNWNDALQEVVLRLSEVEDSSPEMILNDLLAAQSDVVRFRVGGPNTSDGTLPIAAATGLIEGARRALLSSACSVVNRVQHHPRLSRTEVEEFLSVCKMAQTEFGSYVIKVVCPLTEMKEPPILQNDEPFARATTLSLLRGCRKIVQGIEQDNIDDVLKGDSKSPDITSNLCDSLLRMHAAQDNADLSIQISWAAMPKYGIPDEHSVVAFKPEYFNAVKDIQRQLRPQKTQEEKSLLFGTVETLNGNVDDENRRSGEVVFALLLQDEEVVRARGNLTAEYYQKAVNAHEAGQGYVAFSGILKRGVRVARVEEISDFRELATEGALNP